MRISRDSRSSLLFQVGAVVAGERAKCDNRIRCFVGYNGARGLHANERVAPLNTT